MEFAAFLMDPETGYIDPRGSVSGIVFSDEWRLDIDQPAGIEVVNAGIHVAVLIDPHNKYAKLKVTKERSEVSFFTPPGSASNDDRTRGTCSGE